MAATGIPSHILHTQNLERLNDKVAILEVEISQKLNEMKCCLAAETVTETVVQSAKANLSIEGAIPLSYQDLNTVQNKLLVTIEQRFNDVNIAANNHINIVYNNNTQQLNSTAAEKSWWKDWNWNDGVVPHAVPPPEKWSFPNRLSVKRTWICGCLDIEHNAFAP